MNNNINFADVLCKDRQEAFEQRTLRLQNSWAMKNCSKKGLENDASFFDVKPFKAALSK